MNVITFEQRRAKIKTIDNIDEQIRLAKQYAKKLKLKAKNHNGTLAEKLAINEQAKAAEKVHREIRMKSWDIEDELRNKSAL